MVALQTVTWRAAVIGRWLALVLGSLLLLLFLVFFFGEGPPRFNELPTAEKLGFAAVGAMCLGLALAAKWEGAGGLITILGYLAFFAGHQAYQKLGVFDAVAIVGGIHVLCWLRLRTGRPQALVPWRLPRDIAWTLAAVLLVLLVLAANEMFGQPPLMTPSLRPSANLQGAWTQAAPVDAALTIHGDASVTGTIDGAAITHARITYGRSWFGRLLHWNADYVIRGRSTNGDFAAPLMASNADLNGSLFREGRPTRLYLTRR
jgi:hypothetical protein